MTEPQRAEWATGGERSGYQRGGSWEPPAFSAGSRSGWLIYYRPCLRAVVMYRYENWTAKKFEHKRIDAFELWCWRRLMRVPWTARRSSLSILKEISPEYSFEGLMLKLKLQYFDNLMQRTASLEKTVMLGKIEGGRNG